MKYEWKKQDKALYLPLSKPEIVNVPSFSFFIVNGEGSPDNEAFAEAVGALYSLSYGVKMSPKSGVAPQDYFEYSIFPLEGIWSLTERGKTLPTLDRNELVYTLMIRQPSFVTPDFAAQILESVKKKKPNIMLDTATFSEINEGLCAQMLHNGPYSDEPASFAAMEEFCTTNGYTRISKEHREIYLTDARKTAPEKQRTVLRFKVEKTSKS